MYKILIYSLFLITSMGYAQNSKIQVPIMNLQEDFEIIGELGFQFGTIHTVEGKVIEGPCKGYEGGPNILVQSIDSIANQKHIQIPIKPFNYKGEFGKELLPEIKIGSTYRFRVYETAAYVGVPAIAYQEAKYSVIPSTAFYFKNELAAISGEKIKEIKADPSKFINRQALITGVAKNIKDVPHIVGKHWKLELVARKKWEKDTLGKDVVAYGLIKETEKKKYYQIENSEVWFLYIKDMLNKEVKLRGQARSTNDLWWFNYRGNDIYVPDNGKMLGWTYENYYKPIEISGVLRSIKEKDIDKKQIEDNWLIDGKYILLNPSWKPTGELLLPEAAVMYDD